MTQILIIEADEDVRKILKLNLMKTLGCDVVEKATSKEAISLLEILPDIDLVICREAIGSETSGLNVANFFIKVESSIPLLIIGQKVSNYEHLAAIEASQPWKNIIMAAKKMLGISLEESEVAQVRPEYVPVGIYYFLNITSLSIGCDVYIRVKKNDNEYQYIKRLHSGDNFTREDILKYKESGLKELYIYKNHFTEFVNFVTTELVSQLGKAKLEGSARVVLSSEAYEVTLDRIHKLGIDQHTIELVNENLYSMGSSLNENNNLAIFLKSLKENQLSYAYAHSYLCALILHKIVTHFDWESVQVREKLTYVAFFHDISLQDISLMEINSAADIEKRGLKQADIQIVNNHALESSLIIDRLPKIPSGVSSIIKEHHGSKSGIGFPEVLSISIAPISMMFMVVEHFVSEFLKIKESPTTDDYKRIFDMLTKRYNKVTYLQTLTALQSMTQNKKSSKAQT